MVRQRHLEKVLGSTDPWVVPFVVQLVGEYVLEILVVICDELRDLATPGTFGHLAYGQFIVDNPAFFAHSTAGRKLLELLLPGHLREFSGLPGVHNS